MLDLHQYLDTGFAGTSPDAVAGAGGEATMSAATTWMRANGVRAIVGEFNSGPSAASQREIDRMLDYIAANADVYQGWAYWSSGPEVGVAYHDNDPYMLGPITYASPDKPQMAVLQGQMPQDAESLPFAPYVVMLATAGSGELVLSFEPGAGATFHGYRVNGGAWARLGASPVTLTGLPDGTAATIDLLAFNANGYSPIVTVTGTPVAPPVWAPLAWASVDLDFATGNYHGMTLRNAISRNGGLDITSEGLLLQDQVVVSSALRDAAAGEAGTIMLEFSGVPDAAGGYYGAELWARLRVDVADSGRAAFFSMEERTYQPHKAVAGSGAPGAVHRIMLAWDATRPSGDRAWLAVSGGDVAVLGDNHALDRADTVKFSHFGTNGGMNSPVRTAGSLNPRLRRVTVGSDVARSKGDAKAQTSVVALPRAWASASPIWAHRQDQRQLGRGAAPALR